MIRRFTSAPNPAARVARRARQSRRPRRRAGRSGRRRSGPGSAWPRRGPARSRRRCRAGVRELDSSTVAAQLPDRSRASARMTSATPASTPSSARLARTPKRRPSSRCALGRSTSAGESSEVESQESRPRPPRNRQRGVRDVARERAALVERRGEGDHAVARDRAVGGLEPHDPAERGRLSDRAAGVGADRPGCQLPAATEAAEPPDEPPGTRVAVPRVAAPGRSPSSRSTSPSRTRPCWSCRAPGRRPRRGAAPPWPCTAAGSPRGCASRRCSARPARRRGP